MRSLLADSSICPDCRSDLAAGTCTGCGLVLVGPLAQELWSSMLHADALVRRLRSAAAVPIAVPAPIPAAVPASPRSGPITASLPTAPGFPSGPTAPPRVSSASVQNVLLAVGGLCLLVAAAVFIAITWGSLGLAGRTVVLVGITALAGVAAVAVSRRALRGSAETLWGLTAALVLIDLVAGWAAGFFGSADDLDARYVGGLTGSVLLAGALALGAWVATSPVGRLVVPVVVSTAASVILLATEVWTAPRPELAASLAVPVLIAAALLLRRSRALEHHGHVLLALAVVTWCVLAVQGADRAADVTAAHWWHDVLGWPLLVAAVLAGATASVGRLRAEVRYVASSASLACLVGFTVAGTASEENRTVVLSAVVLAVAAISAAAPPIWSRPAAALAGVGVVVATVVTLVRPLAVLAEVPTTARPDHADLGQHLASSSWTLAPWTAVLIAAVAALAALGVLRHLPDAPRATATAAWRTLAPVVVVVGPVTWELESDPTLLVAVLAWTGLVVLAGLLALVLREVPAALTCGLGALGVLVVVDLRLAVASHLLVALLATAIAAVIATAAGRARTDRLGGAVVPVLSAGAVLLAAFAAMHWPYVAGGRGDAAGLTLVLLAAVVGVAGKLLGRTEEARVSIEASALLAAAVAPFLTTSQDLAAVVVTIAGSAVALVSVLERDRDVVSWMATALLATGTLIRLDAGLSAPEILALPAAAVLLTAGSWRLRHDEAVASWRALGSGLSLALVPSLLLALHDPVSLRGVLVGAAGVLVLALGIAGRWDAPFLAGAGVVAVLAVRHLGPVAAALPRWTSLGSVGLALLLAGITWEARRRDAAAAERYLAALR